MNQKPKNLVMSYETVTPNSTFAFTFAPDDSHQHWKSPDRMKSFLLDMRTYFLKTLKGAYIKVMPEVSPLGRLHLHGFITIYAPLDFYLNTIHEIIDEGTVVIKPITEQDDWETYCQKQRLEDDYIYVPPVYKPLKKQNKKPKKKEITDAELYSDGFLESL